jgi:hypothetical protein
MAAEKRTTDKALCPCGRVGTPRATERHATTCEAYASLYRRDPKSPQLDLVAAWRATQDEDYVAAQREAKDELREERRLDYRARNANAVDLQKERWTGGRKFRSTGSTSRPVPPPPGTMLETPAHLSGTAREHALDAMRLAE